MKKLQGHNPHAFRQRSVKEYSNINVQKMKYTKYITFLLCKDGLVYIKNDYYFPNKRIKNNNNRFNMR